MRSNSVCFVGRSTLDLVYYLEGSPAEDSKVFASKFRTQAGGPALNAAVTHSQLGGQSTLVSVIGHGPWADMVKLELERYGVELADLAVGSEFEAPIATVLINQMTGSRTVVNGPQSIASALRLDHKWRFEAGAPAQNIPGLVLLDGHLITEVSDLIAEFHAAGAQLCLDGGSWKPGLLALAPLLHVAICGERFAIPDYETDSETTISWFREHGVPFGAVTRGNKPISAWDGDRRFEIAVPQVDVIDTLGAGDVLHGAFCYYFADGAPFETALQHAAEIATLSCQTLGARKWIDLMQARNAS